jgi:hypothetical protein
MNEYSYDLAFVDAQLHEFQKLAVSSALTGGIGNTGRLAFRSIAKGLARGTAGRGASIGAGVGALSGGVMGAAAADPQQPGGRLVGGLSGAMGGALLGAGVGTAATRAGRTWVGNQVKAQAHGLTGWVPGSRKAGKGFFGQRMSGAERTKALGNIGIKGPESRLSHGQALGAIEKGTITGRLPQGMQQQLADVAVARNKAQRHLVTGGLTSIPGFVKGMAKDPGRTARAGLLAAGGGGAALTAGFSAPELVAAAREKDPKRFGGALAETGFYAMGGGVPMLGSMVLGSGIRRGGELPGEAYEKLKARGQGAA